MIFYIVGVILGGVVLCPVTLWITMSGFWYLNKITMTKLYEQCIEKNTNESLILSEEVKEYLSEYYNLVPYIEKHK